MNESHLQLLLLSNAAATLFMTGVIWFVQVVHYPLFQATGTTEFTAYEQRHTSLTTTVVGPAMCIEGVTACLLFWYRPTGITNGRSRSRSA
jgi:hypothetical protein